MHIHRHIYKLFLLFFILQFHYLVLLYKHIDLLVFTYTFWYFIHFLSIVCNQINFSLLSFWNFVHELSEQLFFYLFFFYLLLSCKRFFFIILFFEFFTNIYFHHLQLIQHNKKKTDRCFN